MKEVIITDKEQGQRVDTFLKKYLFRCSRSLIYKWLRTKKIKCNKKKITPDYIVHSGDILQLYIHEEYIPVTRTQAKSMDTHKTLQEEQIIFQDDHMILVNKPSGITMTGKGDTLVNRLITYLGEDFCTDTFRPAFVHRLDKGTSGIALGVKTYQAARFYTELFRDRKVEKKYYALIKGVPKNVQGSIVQNLQKISGELFVVRADPTGKHTYTSYEIKKTFNDASLVDIDLHTGMTHQIRVHFQSLGHPLAGDRKYGSRAWNTYLHKEYNLNRLFLHKYSLTLPCFETGQEKTFHVDLPEKLDSMLKALNNS